MLSQQQAAAEPTVSVNQTYEAKYKVHVEAAIKAALSKAEALWATQLAERDAKINALENKIAQLTNENRGNDGSGRGSEANNSTTALSWARVTSNGTTAIANKYTDQQVQLLNATATEQQDRAARANNVIVVGIPVAVTTDQAERVALDKTAVSNLFTAMKISGRAKGLHRLPGRTRDNSGPIVVTLNSQAERNAILRAAKTLKNHADFSSVFIRPDETPVQQRESKRLREEIKKLNENLAAGSTFRYGIRNYTIVRRPTTESTRA